ncbi:MAG TPA: AsnC family transcriptional regulator [Nitrososphaeraceae archaeon]|jgi:DNA-binding Lrp family transcriptional regulator
MLNGVITLFPVQLDDTDLAIINTLMKDGRKSFRQIASETGITAPTAKARFDRLVNIGFLKSISPVFDFTKVENDPNSGILKTKQSTSHHLCHVTQQLANQKLPKI